MKCAIIANGGMSDHQVLTSRLSHYDLIIGCDGGGRHLDAIGIRPHVVLGDFDSLPPALLASYQEPPAVETLPFPPEKDYTDSYLAIDLALSRGATEIDLFGVTGSRLDHTLANIFSLRYINERGSFGRIIDDHNLLFLAELGTTIIQGSPGQLLSLVALSDPVTGVTLSGLQYPLNNATLRPCMSVGISNVFTAGQATVTKASGELLIILSRD